MFCKHTPTFATCQELFCRQEEPTSPSSTRQRRNSPLCWLVWDGEHAAADYLVAAGWDVSQEDWLHLPGGTDEQIDFMGKLIEYSRQTRPLVITCRDRIREELSKASHGREILSRIDKLPLPNKIKDFLKLNDL